MTRIESNKTEPVFGGWYGKFMLLIAITCAIILCFGWLSTIRTAKELNAQRESLLQQIAIERQDIARLNSKLDGVSQKMDVVIGYTRGK